DDSTDTWTPWAPCPHPNNGGPTVSPLVWRFDDVIGGVVLSDLMKDLDRGDIIEIRFDIEAACDFAGGTMQVETEYKNPCMETVNPDSVGTFLMAVRLPELTIEKTRTAPAAGAPVDCGVPVTWSIVVTNTGEIAAPVVWVEDTMEGGFTFASSTGGVDGGDNGYGGDPLVTTWEIVNLLPGPANAVTLTLTANSDGGSCEEIDNAVEAFWGCGIPDNDSSTKPGVDEGVGDQCLTDAEERDTDESTRQPTLGYLSVGMFPTEIDSCNDSTELTVVLENTGAVDAHNVDLVITLPPNVDYLLGTSLFGQGADSGVGVGPIGNPVQVGSVLTWYDVDVKGVGSDLTGVIEAGGDPNDTAVLKFRVESSCYTTANMAFDIRYYSCCDDTQY
ncbi:MAG: DUF11 domain-containing protein, partial [bacterium]|nr:DUF11 domain-containing protein [bacterium]